MLGRLRSLARRVLGVTRESTYYLPWLTRPGLECVVLVNNIESRFTSGRAPPPPAWTRRSPSTTPSGGVVGVYTTALTDSADAREVRADADGGRPRLRDGADAAGSTPTSTWRWSTARATARRTAGRSSSSTIRRGRGRRWRSPAALLAAAGAHRAALRARPVRLSRPGQPLARAHLQPVERRQPHPRGRHPRRRARPGPGCCGCRRWVRPCSTSARWGRRPSRLVVERLRLTGNAWFNLYLVGAGAARPRRRALADACQVSRPR